MPTVQASIEVWRKYEAYHKQTGGTQANSAKLEIVNVIEDLKMFSFAYISLLFGCIFHSAI